MPVVVSGYVEADAIVCKRNASIAGKRRLDAVHLIASLPGVQTVSITGVQDNQALPTDAAHIHVLIYFFVL